MNEQTLAILVILACKSLLLFVQSIAIELTETKFHLACPHLPLFFSPLFDFSIVQTLSSWCLLDWYTFNSIWWNALTGFNPFLITRGEIQTARLFVCLFAYLPTSSNRCSRNRIYRKEFLSGKKDLIESVAVERVKSFQIGSIFFPITWQQIGIHSGW